MARIVSLVLLVGGVLSGGCASSNRFLAAPGMKAPPLQIPNQYGQLVDLREATSGEWSAVFFYPKANTPG